MKYKVGDTILGFHRYNPKKYVIIGIQHGSYMVNIYELNDGVVINNFQFHEEELEERENKYLTKYSKLGQVLE